MFKKLKQHFSRSRLLAVGLVSLLALASGCTEPVTLYHVPGSEVYLAQGRKILILPFMDTRTYVAKEDQKRGDIGAYTRDIFVEALREFNADQVVDILTPKMPRRTRSLTNAQVAELGREYGADLVVAGQVFSFTDTRAASIPPRAGMFVRIINAHDGSLLFVGDHYRAAGFPGADGGRELQALFVSARLIEGFLSKIQPAFMAAGDIASAGAFAMLSPKPMRQGLLSRLFRKKHAAAPGRLSFRPSPFGSLYSSEVAGVTANREPKRGGGEDGGKRREPGNVPETERYLGLTANLLFSPDQWDEQFVPEVPPLVDFDEDFYVLPAPLAGQPEPEPLPPPFAEKEQAEVAERADEPVVAARADAEMESAESEDESRGQTASGDGDLPNGTLAVMEPSAPPIVAEPAVAERRTEQENEAVVEQPAVVAEAPVQADAADSAEVPQVEGGVSAAAVTAAEPAPVLSQELDFSSLDRVAERPLYENVVVDPTSAMVVDELPEIDMARVYPNIVHADTPYPAPAPSAKLSGDELASDLFDAEGEVWRIAPSFDSGAIFSGVVSTPAPGDFAMSMTPETPVLLSSVTGADGRPYALTYEDIGIGGGEGRYAFELDPETLEVVPAPANRRPPVAASSVREERIVSEVIRMPGGESAGMSSAGPRPATKPRETGRRTVRSQSVKGAMVAGKSRASADAVTETPVLSMPLASEQPRTVKSVDNQLTADPYAVMQDPMALVEMPVFTNMGGRKVLVLPYHERNNPNNLIYNTGGGEVVTTLFGTQLASAPGITVMWDTSGQATHNSLISRDDAISMGRLAGADYVMRGQVIEFRRAQSVPSFYSAVISTAVLAAQLFFAEMSGVDVATEVYRVADGMCVMSRRDRSQQKYVVQAEKTVRRMASAMVGDVSAILRSPWLAPMDPLIDELSPVSVLSDPET